MAGWQHTSPLPPLHELLRLPSAAEDFWWQVPVLGWGIGTLMLRNRYQRVSEWVEEQLRARPPTPPEAWGPDPRRRNLAAFLCEVIAREIGWSVPHFMPDDPLETLCLAGGPQKTDFAVALAVSDRLSTRLSAENWVWLCRQTVGRAVEVLLTQVGRFCLNCGYDLTGNVSGVCPECGTGLPFG